MIELTGHKLIKSLGLEKIYLRHNSIYITRLLVPMSQKVNIVFYNSLRAMSKGEMLRHGVYPGMGYYGLQLSRDELEFNHTPLLNLDQFNGQIEDRFFITVDCAFQKHLNKRNFTKLPENKIPDSYIGKNLLKEITLGDLQYKQTIAPTTMEFRKERNKLMGNEARNAKLIDVVLDQGGNNITFQFLTETTPKYPKNYKYKDVDPNSLELKNNPSKTYELQIKVLKFFDWLDVFEGEKITDKEIKEVLEVSDVQVFNTSPSFQFQSYNWNMSQLDASIYPTDIPSKVWAPERFKGEYFLDKHLYGLIQGLGFWHNPMASMLTKKLKDRGLI